MHMIKDGYIAGHATTPYLSILAVAAPFPHSSQLESKQNFIRLSFGHLGDWRRCVAYTNMLPSE